MIIRVVHERAYTVIDNTPIEDANLSFRTLGVLTYLLSRPDQWEANYRHLATVRSEGEAVLRQCLSELEQAGYLERHRERGENGRWVWIQVIHEIPAGQTMRRSTTHGEPRAGGPGVVDQRAVDARVVSTEEEVLDEQVRTATNPPTPPGGGDDDLVEDPLGDPADQPSVVRRVFDAWLESTGKTTRTVLDSKRRGKIERALRDYPLDDVLDAVRGWENSPHHRGENDERKVWNDIELLLRNATKIELFRDLARGPRVERSGPKSGQAAGNDKVRGFRVYSAAEMEAEGL